jgi:inhibitor of cysteine peptidase
MRARMLVVLSMGLILVAAAVYAETPDRSKVLTHPVNVVGPAKPAQHAAGAADRSQVLTHPLNVVGPAEEKVHVAEAVEVRLPKEGGTQSATLAVGQKLVVAIAGNPSTGYEWELTGPVAGAVLEQEGRVTFVAGATDIVGAPGEYRFAFKATGPGMTAVGIKYVRPWEQNVAPAATATVHVTVSK